jgi:hypothetical protein
MTRDVLTEPQMPPQRLLYAVHTGMSSIAARLTGFLSQVEYAAFDDSLRALSETPGRITDYAGGLSAPPLCAFRKGRGGAHGKSASMIGGAGLSERSVCHPGHHAGIRGAPVPFQLRLFRFVVQVETGQPFIQYLNALRIENASACSPRQTSRYTKFHAGPIFGRQVFHPRV